MSILNNSLGNQQATSKVLRALKRSSGLAHLVLGQNTAVVVENLETGKVEKSIAVKVDYQRVASVLEHNIRGIYFHHYGEPWASNVNLVAEFMMALDVPEALAHNERLEELRKIAHIGFEQVEKHGRHQDVFCYQIIDRLEDSGQIIMRLSFYGSTSVSAFLVR